jgi:hypothetical protein
MDCRRDVCVANMRGVRDVRSCATKMGLESGAGQVFNASVQCTLDDPIVSSIGAV